MMLRVLLISATLAIPLAAQAAPRLTEAEVRAFVERQSKAWNAGDLGGYFALYAPDARFTDQARAKDGRVVPYGTSTLAEAKAQTRRARAGSKVQEVTTLRAIQIAPDGKSAQVAAAEASAIATGARTRRLCAERVQTIVLTPAGPRSKGQTDTYLACR